MVKPPNIVLATTLTLLIASNSLHSHAAALPEYVNLTKEEIATVEHSKNKIATLSQQNVENRIPLLNGFLALLLPGHSFLDERGPSYYQDKNGYIKSGEYQAEGAALADIGLTGLVLIFSSLISWAASPGNGSQKQVNVPVVVAAYSLTRILSSVVAVSSGINSNKLALKVKEETLFRLNGDIERIISTANERANEIDTALANADRALSSRDYRGAIISIASIQDKADPRGVLQPFMRLHAQEIKGAADSYGIEKVKEAHQLLANKKFDEASSALANVPNNSSSQKQVAALTKEIQSKRDQHYAQIEAAKREAKKREEQKLEAARLQEEARNREKASELVNLPFISWTLGQEMKGSVIVDPDRGGGFYGRNTDCPAPALKPGEAFRAFRKNSVYSQEPTATLVYFVGKSGTDPRTWRLRQFRYVGGSEVLHDLSASMTQFWGAPKTQRNGVTVWTSGNYMAAMEVQGGYVVLSGGLIPR